MLTEQAQPALSFLTEVEFTSAVAKKVRLQHLDSVDGQRILAKFTAHVEAGLFRMIPVEKHHYRQEAGSAFCQRPCGPSRRSTWPSPPVKNCPWSPRTHPFSRTPGCLTWRHVSSPDTVSKSTALKEGGGFGPFPLGRTGATGASTPRRSYAPAQERSKIAAKDDFAWCAR